MRTLFVDTAYWIAQFDVKDQLHQKALEVEGRLGAVRLVTSELVLAEFLNFFSSRGMLTRQEASGVVQDILQTSVVHIVWQSQQLFEAGVMLYRDRLDKGYSLTDCVSMVVMRQEAIQEALTHDRHFLQEGFTILL